MRLRSLFCRSLARKKSVLIAQRKLISSLTFISVSLSGATQYCVLHEHATLFYE